MNCIVTAGPTYEPLDEVRRLTNFSTGRLGSELADFLTARGHDVILLRGSSATWPATTKPRHIKEFTTTADLESRLSELAGPDIGAVFHVAAVADFRFGEIWERSDTGELKPSEGRKISSRKGQMLAELLPTPKIISKLRPWFPQARLIGWKYELDGDRQRTVALAREQIDSNRTDACVVNGAAYGKGFGLVTRDRNCEHLSDAPSLFAALERILKR